MILMMVSNLVLMALKSENNTSRVTPGVYIADTSIVSSLQSHSMAPLGGELANRMGNFSKSSNQVTDTKSLIFCCFGHGTSLVDQSITTLSTPFLRVPASQCLLACIAGFEHFLADRTGKSPFKEATTKQHRESSDRQQGGFALLQGMLRISRSTANTPTNNANASQSYHSQ